MLGARPSQAMAPIRFPARVFELPVAPSLSRASPAAHDKFTCKHDKVDRHSRIKGKPTMFHDVLEPLRDLGNKRRTGLAELALLLAIVAFCLATVVTVAALEWGF